LSVSLNQEDYGHCLSSWWVTKVVGDLRHYLLERLVPGLETSAFSSVAHFHQAVAEQEVNDVQGFVLPFGQGQRRILLFDTPIDVTQAYRINETVVQDLVECLPSVRCSFASTSLGQQPFSIAGH
jgi:hypothetical protein